MRWWPFLAWFHRPSATWHCAAATRRRPGIPIRAERWVQGMPRRLTAPRGRDARFLDPSHHRVCERDQERTGQSGVGGKWEGLGQHSVARGGRLGTGDWVKIGQAGTRRHRLARGGISGCRLIIRWNAQIRWPASLPPGPGSCRVRRIKSEPCRNGCGIECAVSSIHPSGTRFAHMGI